MANRIHISRNKVDNLKALGDTILVHGMDFSQRMSGGGIILLDDDMKSSGIRPRWAQVYAIGPKVKDVNVNDYILIAHGRWTRGICIVDDEGEKVIRKIDPNDILLISDEPVFDETLSDKAI
jgi:co-chaperonin GroES (HSP10)